MGGKPVREVLFNGPLVHIECADEHDGGMVRRCHGGEGATVDRRRAGGKGIRSRMNENEERKERRKQGEKRGRVCVCALFAEQRVCSCPLKVTSGHVHVRPTFALKTWTLLVCLVFSVSLLTLLPTAYPLPRWY